MGTSNNLGFSTGSHSRHNVIFSHPLCSLSSQTMLLPLLLALIFAVGDFQTGKLFYSTLKLIINIIRCYHQHILVVQYILYNVYDIHLVILNNLILIYTEKYFRSLVDYLVKSCFLPVQLSGNHCFNSIFFKKSNNALKKPSEKNLENVYKCCLRKFGGCHGILQHIINVLIFNVKHQR